MKNFTFKNTSVFLVLTILASCLLTAIAQAGAFFYSSHHTKLLIMALRTAA